LREGKPDDEKHVLLDLRETKKKLLQMLGMTHQFIMQQFDFLHVKGFLEIKDTAIVFLDPARFTRYVSFLRLFQRKAFDKIPSLTAEAAQVCEAFAAQHPEPGGQENGSCTISADEITAIIAKLGLQDKAALLMAELKENALLTPQKKESGDAKAPPASFVADATLMHKLTLFNTFSKLVPLA
jgi:hypothetical protein